jgi:hypothetical protein
MKNFLQKIILLTSFFASFMLHAQGDGFVYGECAPSLKDNPKGKIIVRLLTEEELNTYVHHKSYKENFNSRLIEYSNKHLSGKVVFMTINEIAEIEADENQYLGIYSVVWGKVEKTEKVMILLSTYAFTDFKSNTGYIKNNISKGLWKEMEEGLKTIKKCLN